MDSALECGHLCLSEHPRCKSMNYEKGEKPQTMGRSKCQLNNDTRATKLPKELVPDFAFNYFEPFKVSYGLVILLSKHQSYQVCC